MGVVSRRWMWVESMSVASGCGLYIGFLILLIPIYIYTPLFFATAPLLFCSFF